VCFAFGVRDIGDLYLVVTRKTDFYVVEEHGIVSHLLINCHPHTRAIPFQVFAHLH
jgi:hypothetical protein